jgi:hypothetical protein
VRRHRIDISTLRAALWTLTAVRQTRRTLRRGGVRSVQLSWPPQLPATAGRGVRGVLTRSRATCLERSLVLQRWELAQGRPRAVIIGVRAPGAAFTAHAWLDGAPDRLACGFHELMRIPATRE